AGRAPPAPAGGPQPRSPWQRTLLPPAARRRIMGVIPPYGRGEQERPAFRSAAAGPPADPTNPGCDAVLGTAPRLSISVYNCGVCPHTAGLPLPCRPGGFGGDSCGCRNRTVDPVVG